MDTVSSTSTEYVRSVKVKARRAGVTLTLSSYPVRMALVERGVEPAEDDWGTATWETDDDREWAKVLIGPDGVVNPGPGTWTMWIEVDVSPELVRQPVGRLRIT